MYFNQIYRMELINLIVIADSHHYSQFVHLRILKILSIFSHYDSSKFGPRPEEYEERVRR